LEWLKKLQEGLKDNPELLKILTDGTSEITALQESNTNLASQAETWEKRFNEGVATRQTQKTTIDNLNTEIETLKLSGDNEGIQKQLTQLKDEYDTKLKESESKYGSLNEKYVNSLRKSSFGELNLASLLPKGLSEEAIKSAVDFMQFDLSNQGMGYDTEIDNFVFKKEGVNSINPETSKPYTVKEMAGQRAKSGAWDMFINTTPNPAGTDRGNAESGGSMSPSIEVKKGNANALMDVAFEKN
jgi:hypothetical protein